MESVAVQSTAVCLMISLIAGLGTGKGSDPPLLHAARGVICLGSIPFLPGHRGGLQSVFAFLHQLSVTAGPRPSSSLAVLSSGLWGCFLAFGSQATVQ